MSSTSLANASSSMSGKTFASGWKRAFPRASFRWSRSVSFLESLACQIGSGQLVLLLLTHRFVLVQPVFDRLTGNVRVLRLTPFSGVIESGAHPGCGDERQHLREPVLLVQFLWHTLIIPH